MLTALENLKYYFGYDSFRSGQEALIGDILGGRDVLCIMPTGAGKSMCFQIPALMMDGITLIISPLISLMKDQVNALVQSGIQAAFINSSLNEQQINKALRNAANGAYKLIYVAPERLLSYGFLSFAQAARVSMLTVDEAHCISKWGQDFRPSYGEIPDFISKLKNRPVVSAFTATATPAVREDIVSQLRLREPTIYVSGFDRPNLYFEVKKPKDKFLALTAFLKGKANRSGIIYCSTRAAVEEVCDMLKARGFNASRYHAGLSDSERASNQDDFLYDRVRFMVATNAFGMGIDKSNVSFVVHYNMPLDIEGYYQESGRAGRDGSPADCLLLYSGQDVHTNRWLIEHSAEADDADPELVEILKERNLGRLRDMTFYCSTGDCLRSYILRYFGEKPPHYCGNCGNCNSNFVTVDATIDAQKIISCVFRMRQGYGQKILMDVLRGAKNEKISRLGFNKLSTYGICDMDERRLRRIIDHMVSAGYLVKTDGEYPVIKLGRLASAILRDEEKMLLKLPKDLSQDLYAESNSGSAAGPAARSAAGLTAGPAAGSAAMPAAMPAAGPAARPVDQKLLACLKELRQTIANERKVPAFTILHDSSLVDMCIKMPATPDEFLKISGIGKIKFEQHGERFLNAIANYLQGGLPASDVSIIKDPAAERLNPSNIEISENAVTVSAIADRANCVLIERRQGRIAGQHINGWLISKGFIETTEINGKHAKVPTDAGAKLGIEAVDRKIRGVDVKICLFNTAAQTYIVENIEKIIKFKEKG